VLLYCQELPRAIEAFDSLCYEAENDPAFRGQVENSYRRITELKRRYFRGFTGVAEEKLVARLAKLDHQAIVDEIQGNL
jgi:hypothetical protein